MAAASGDLADSAVRVAVSQACSSSRIGAAWLRRVCERAAGDCPRICRSIL